MTLTVKLPVTIERNNASVTFHDVRGMVLYMWVTPVKAQTDAKVDIVFVVDDWDDPVIEDIDISPVKANRIYGMCDHGAPLPINPMTPLKVKFFNAELGARYNVTISVVEDEKGNDDEKS